jgi:hypothetical protein
MYKTFAFMYKCLFSHSPDFSPVPAPEKSYNRVEAYIMAKTGAENC